jgi:hypothetical protein
MIGDGRPWPRQATGSGTGPQQTLVRMKSSGTRFRSANNFNNSEQADSKTKAPINKGLNDG